jgi:single-stranded-DNA-specific exonuclease
VDAVVAGDAVGLDLAEEIERLRPFGMGNPGVRLLVPAARVSDVRPMGEGRHARFTVTSGGVRSRGVAFGVGRELANPARSSDLAGNSGDGLEPSHDLIARLEVNEWQGAVEPRLVLSSLHPVDEAEPSAPGDRAVDCAECACRARGPAWWDAVWSSFEKPAEVHPRFQDTSSRQRTVIDRRGQGIVGSLSDLLSTGEPVLALCSDVSRRRAVLQRRVDPVRFGRSAAIFVSTRCAHPIEPELPPDAFCLVDYSTVEAVASLADSFTHVFLLDPPPFERLSVLLHRAADVEEGARFLHLGWGSAEAEFTRKVIEHDYGLRAPLAAIYRALAANPAEAADAALESLLMGEGRHTRNPAVVGRCLRVLVELGLAELERSGATVKCTITGKGRVDLECSSAFLACTRLYQEALAFLSEPTQQTTQRKAA